MSPATNFRGRRAESITTLTMELEDRPVGRSRCFPRAPGCRRVGRNRHADAPEDWGHATRATVSRAAIPGQMSLRPPEKPAIRWGSIKPTVIFKSADT